MIYLDNHATTPCDPRVVDCMVHYFATLFGNASSDHPFGEAAAAAVSTAGNQVNDLLNGAGGSVIFTSGATESNNIILLGAAEGFFKRTGKKGKIVTTPIEHKAILSPLQHLESSGWQIAYLPLDKTGLVDIERAAEIIDQDTVLVSVQVANSEIGTIQPIKALAALTHLVGGLFHTDAAQALGKIAVDVKKLDADLVSISGHKVYGPKGIGAIWGKEESLQAIQPIIFGGDSGSRLRPGTLPVPLIVGLGAACELCLQALPEEETRLAALRDEFEARLFAEIPGLILNGNRDSRLPNNSNVIFPYVEAEMLLSNLNDIIASTGSACESGSIGAFKGAFSHRKKQGASSLRPPFRPWPDDHYRDDLRSCIQDSESLLNIISLT